MAQDPKGGSYPDGLGSYSGGGRGMGSYANATGRPGAGGSYVGAPATPADPPPTVISTSGVCVSPNTQVVTAEINEDGRFKYRFQVTNKATRPVLGWSADSIWFNLDAGVPRGTVEVANVPATMHWHVEIFIENDAGTPAANNRYWHTFQVDLLGACP